MNPTNNEQSSQAKKPRSAFTPDEDKRLCNAWIFVSQNRKVGNLQDGDTFWKRILKRFLLSYKATTSVDSDSDNTTTATLADKTGGNTAVVVVNPNDRDINSLSNRFNIIKRDVSKFCGVYANIERQNQSGSVEVDKLQAAIDSFKEIHSSSFNVLHCYIILKVCPMWRKESKGPSKKGKDRQVFLELQESSSSSPIVDSQEDEETATVLARPCGRKAVKTEEKNLQESNSMKEKALAMNAQFISDNKSNFEEFMKSQEMDRKIKEEEIEERIMEIDLNTIACPKRRRYFELKQNKILAKLEDEMEEEQVNKSNVELNL